MSRKTPCSATTIETDLVFREDPFGCITCNILRLPTPHKASKLVEKPKKIAVQKNPVLATGRQIGKNLNSTMVKHCLPTTIVKAMPAPDLQTKESFSHP